MIVDVKGCKGRKFTLNDSGELQDVDYLRIFKRLHVLEVFVSGGWELGKGEEGEKRLEGV